MKLKAVLLLVVVVGLVASPAGVRAQDTQETIDKIVELNREAVAQYQKKKYENARKALKQALDLCGAAGLERHPVAARTHVHLGIVIIGGFGQREIGAKQFGEALQIQPDIALTPGVASPAIQDVFNEMAVAVTPKAATPAPAPVADAEDAAPAAASEREEPRAAPASDEPPVVARRAAPAVSRRESHEENDETDEDDESGRANAGFQVGALIGAGAGWASGNGDVNANVPVDSGFAAAKLGHVALEAGYWVSPSLMVSLQGRFQKVSGPTIVEANGKTYEPASGATAFFAALTWSPVKARLRPYFVGAIGGGRIRHVVTLSSLHDCGPNQNETCVDTVGAGPVIGGVGGGVTYDLGDRLSLVAGVNTHVAAPRFTFNIDFNAGVAFRL